MEKKSSVIVIGVFFSIFCTFLSKFAENEFISYLATNFHLCLKNSILGNFSRKFTIMNSFYIYKQRNVAQGRNSAVGAKRRFRSSVHIEYSLLEDPLKLNC